MHRRSPRRRLLVRRPPGSAPRARRAATISITRAPSVHAGHVAGWVGVGGPGQGANGSDEWIQAGIAAMPGRSPFLYTEITRPSGETRFVLIETRR